MKKLWLIVFFLCWVAKAYALDVQNIGANEWVKILDNVPNSNNASYENDFNCDPVFGLTMVGPGHRGSPQDNHYYIYDPQASLNGVEEWTSPHTALRPGKKCLAKFCVSTNELAIINIGGSAGHQNSLGRFNSDYTRIEDKLYTAYDIYFYDMKTNRWHDMKTAGKRHPGCRGFLAHHRIKYDPVHDVAVIHGGNLSANLDVVANSWVYNLHDNEWTMLTPDISPGPRQMYAADIDTRRGVYYFMGGSDGSGDWGQNYITDMWALNVDTGQWSQISGSLPGGQSSYVHSMAYDPWSDAILYMEGRSGYSLKSFDIATQTWSSVTTPAFHPSSSGRLAFNEKYNLLFLLGGEGDDGRHYDGLWAYRFQNHDLVALRQSKPKPPVAQLSTAGGMVNLTWDLIPNETYHIYRGTANPYPRQFIQITSIPITENNYTDATAITGTRYAYKITAVIDGIEGDTSKILYTRPARPLGVVASVEAVNQVLVSWDTNLENDLMGYNIYRTQGVGIYAESFNYQKLNGTPITTIQWTDNVDLSDGIARGYIVTAVNAFGLESGYSPVATTFPERPIFFKSSDLGNDTQLEWQAPPRTKHQGVNIYRGNTYDQVNPVPVNGSPLLGNSIVLNNTKGPYGHGTFTLRTLNILGQEGFITDQISPDGPAINNQYTDGVGPLPKFEINPYLEISEPTPLNAPKRLRIK